MGERVNWRRAVDEDGEGVHVYQNNGKGISGWWREDVSGNWELMETKRAVRKNAMVARRPGPGAVSEPFLTTV